MSELPAEVETALQSYLLEAKRVFDDRLVSAVLYGSAAEGRLRATSDVNLLLVLGTFLPEDAAALASAMEFAQAAIDLQVMFLLESELETASQLFAVKFLNISHRRRVLLGSDPFLNVQITRSALIARLRQVLLNHLLRIRSAIISGSKSTYQLVALLADSAGPLRAAAGAIRELRNEPIESPRSALFAIAKELRPDGYVTALETVSSCREGDFSEPSSLSSAVNDIAELTARMKELVKTLPT